MRPGKDNPKSADAIRRRSEELAFPHAGNTAEIEVLAAISEGTLSFDQIDEDVLNRCLQSLGTDAVIEAFLNAESGAGMEEKKVPARITDTEEIERSAGKPIFSFPNKGAAVYGWGEHRVAWILAAAAVLIVGVLLFKAKGVQRAAEPSVAQLSQLPKTTASGTAQIPSEQTEAKRSGQSSGMAQVPSAGSEKEPPKASYPAGEHLPKFAAPPVPSIAPSTSHADPSARQPSAAFPKDETANNSRVPPQQSGKEVVPGPSIAAEAIPQRLEKQYPLTAAHGLTTAFHAAPTTLAANGGPAGRPAATSLGGFGGAAAGSGAHSNVAAVHGPVGRPVPPSAGGFYAANGALIRNFADGKPKDVHDDRRGMDIHHDLHGERRISVERADHSRVFAERGGRGYVQHPYNYHGHEYGHRTYYRDGHAYDRYYGRSYYRGQYLDVYAPARYYSPGFYGWAYNPWAAPISYSWGWSGNPWYGYYGGYFTPYPVYPSASYWLTDYLISQSLASAYQARAADQQAALEGVAPITPDIKKMVADEVQRQIALENAEGAQNAHNQDIDSGSSSIARMLGDNRPHVFIAGSSLDLVDSTGAECSVSQGDVLEVASAPPAAATAAPARVLSSKGGRECKKSVNVQVAFTDLQDMQNHMRETIDAGLGDLQTKQGQGGLPPAPSSAKLPPVASSFAAAAPPPDPNAAMEISQQVREADKAEQEVASAAPVQTKTIAVGQNINDVTSAFGTPTTVINNGGTQVYVYPDMKVTFKGGKVTDVQ